MATYTLKPGHTRTFLLGTPRKSGEHVVVDTLKGLSAYDREALETHFDCIKQDDVKPAPKAKKTLSNGLTNEQARQKLTAAGVPVQDGETDEHVEELYNRVFASLSLGKDQPPKQPEGQQPGDGAGKDAPPPGQDVPPAGQPAGGQQPGDGAGKQPKK